MDLVTDHSTVGDGGGSKNEERCEGVEGVRIDQSGGCEVKTRNRCLVAASRWERF
jgi:hypothetical protein